jgi:hypothetical protein
MASSDAEPAAPARLAPADVSSRRRVLTCGCPALPQEGCQVSFFYEAVDFKQYFLGTLVKARPF